MTREPLAIDNLHIVIKVLAVVQLLGMAHRSIPSSNQGVQDPGFTGYPEVFQFREMMRTLSGGVPPYRRGVRHRGRGVRSSRPVEWWYGRHCRRVQLR